MELLNKNLKSLKKGETIEKPVYNFVTHERSGFEDFEPADVIIIEGLWALNSLIKDEIDFKIFIEASKSVRLNRRIDRDVAERGRTKENVIKQFNETVEPMYEVHVLPTQEYADLIVGNE